MIWPKRRCLANSTERWAATTVSEPENVSSRPPSKHWRVFRRSPHSIGNDRLGADAKRKHRRPTIQGRRARRRPSARLAASSDDETLARGSKSFVTRCQPARRRHCRLGYVSPKGLRRSHLSRIQNSRSERCSRAHLVRRFKTTNWCRKATISSPRLWRDRTKLCSQVNTAAISQSINSPLYQDERLPC